MTAVITPRQQDVLRFVAGYSYSNGYPPTQQEIADKLGIGVPTVNGHLNELVDRGLLRKTANMARGYQPVDLCPTCNRPMGKLSAGENGR